MDTTQETGIGTTQAHRHGINTPRDRWMMTGTLIGLATSGVLILSIYFVYYPGIVRLVILLSAFPLMMIGGFTAAAAHAVFSRVVEFMSGRYW